MRNLMNKYFSSVSNANKFALCCVVSISMLLSACGGGSGSSKAPPVLTGIVVTPATAAIAVSTTVGLTATGNYSDGTTANLTSQVAWTSANSATASVSATGIVTASASALTGATTITATFNGFHSASSVSVIFGGVTSGQTLYTGRYDHTATLLTGGTNSGKVLVTGGYNSASISALTSSELYDPAVNTWTQSTSFLSVGRGDHTATLLSNGYQVLALGGASGVGGGAQEVSSAELYDANTDTWSPTSSLNFARSYHAVTLLDNGMVLVVGGVGVSGILDSAEIYDPNFPLAPFMTLKAPLSMKRYSLTATLLPPGGSNAGKVLVAGGFGGVAVCDLSCTALSVAELYDPVANTWSPTGNLISGRHSHTATVLTAGPNIGKVLVVGGTGAAGQDLASAEIYDPATESWTATGSLNTARYNHMAVQMNNGEVWVIGGSNSANGTLASVESYDPTTDKWTAKSDLLIGRATHTATQLLSLSTNGKVLVVGGDGVSGTLSSVELYW